MRVCFMRSRQEDIKVEYIDHMGCDMRAANVARVSFNKWHDESTELEAKDKGLLTYLATGLPASERDDWEARAKASCHWSPFAHCFLSVRCAAPIFLARQLVKHQVGLSWNEESRRYITEPVNYWLPESISEKPLHAKQGAGGAHPDSKIHRTRMAEQSMSAITYYEDLLAAGVAPEEARTMLPQNAVTHWVWSGSLMAFMRVIKQRKDGHAQKAAQVFAQQLEEIVIDKFPFSVEAFKC